jgi:hypothetical protein
VGDLRHRNPVLSHLSHPSQEEFTPEALKVLEQLMARLVAYPKVKEKVSGNG